MKKVVYGLIALMFVGGISISYATKKTTHSVYVTVRAGSYVSMREKFLYFECGKKKENQKVTCSNVKKGHFKGGKFIIKAKIPSRWGKPFVLVAGQGARVCPYQNKQSVMLSRKKPNSPIFMSPQGHIKPNIVCGNYKKLSK